MKRSSLAMVALLTWPALAQERVPELPFTSVPDYPTLPDGMNFGEVPGVAVNSRGHVFVFSRSNSATGPAFGAGGGATLRVRSKRRVRPRNRQGAVRLVLRAQRPHRSQRQHLGHRQRFEHGRQVQPEGRVVWVFGRKEEAADGAEPLEHRRPAAASGRRHVPSAHRRGVGLTGQHLHHRRLHQLARRQVRQERRLGEVMGHKGSGPGQFDMPHAIAIDRKTTSTWATAATVASRCSTPTANSCACSRSTCRRPPLAPVNGPTPTGAALTRAIGAPNSMCITPGRPSAVRRRVHVPGPYFQAIAGRQGARRHRPGGAKPGQFSGAHALACPSESEIYVGETSNWRVQKLLLQ